MIETIGPAGHTGGRSTTSSACATFTARRARRRACSPSALLALLGELLEGAGGGFAVPGRGGDRRRCGGSPSCAECAILPQLRRQLPEHWRRVMPMPLAAGLYGVLLGLGFTTFVLTFGVFALAGIAFAVGDPAVGLAVGLAFGVGRALPIVLVAPIADRGAGIRITETMADRPGDLPGRPLRRRARAARGRRSADRRLSGGRRAHRVAPGRRPVGGRHDLAFQRPNGSGVLRSGRRDIRLPG